MEHKEASLIIPCTPPSTQHIYGYMAFGRGRMKKYMTAKAKDFKKLVTEMWIKEHGNECLFKEDKLDVTVELNFATKRRVDCDNYNKAILDSLNEYAYTDDSQIYKLEITKKIGVGKDNAYTKITIKPVSL